MQQLEFTLTGDYIELHQLIKLCGLAASGGAGKAMVAMGLVSVDGAPESRKTAKIRAGQQVTLEDTTIFVVEGDASDDAGASAD